MSHCDWAKINERNRLYHDTEWGVPIHDDDRKMFEHLSLECLQCGLSWDLMLKKREVFRHCFDHFDFDRIANYEDADVDRILNTENMLKSERKIRAIIHNARQYQKIRQEFGSFCSYLWSYSDGKTILYEGHATQGIPAKNGLSERISKDLKKRGFKYIGAVTVYSHLQACGLINDHAEDCPCFHRINAAYPTIYLKPDQDA